MFICAGALAWSGCRTPPDHAPTKTVKQPEPPVVTALEPSTPAVPDPIRSIPPVKPIESYAAIQESIFEEFLSAAASPERERNAYILSDLWRAGLLKDSIMNALVNEHYRVTVMQLNAETPTLMVRAYGTFPFPTTWASFIPTLYRNDEIIWEPKLPQTSHALSLNNAILTSRTGGTLRNGDVIQYRIDVEQTLPNTEPEGGGENRRWRATLWTNKIVLAGLKEPR